MWFVLKMTETKLIVSYDIVDEDRDPRPSAGASHGTAMAGIVAAVANNSACAAGVAFDARIGMVRLGGAARDGFRVTDIMRLDYNQPSQLSFPY